MSEHQLTLGTGFDLIGGTGDGWMVETIAEGMNFGSASPVDVVTATLLQDGAVETTDRWENRDLTFGVLITGETLSGLARGEAALYAELARRSTLTWTPPDGLGLPSVYEVLTSWAEFEFDDWGEMKPVDVGRRFVVRLRCAPWARSVDEVLVESITGGVAPPAEATETVDACTSPTGWAVSSRSNTAPDGDAGLTGPTVSGGAIVGGFTWATEPWLWPTLFTNVSLTRTGLSADMDDTRFLVIETDWSSPISGLMTKQTFRVNGEVVNPAAQVGSKIYIDCAEIATVTSVEVEVRFSYTTRYDATMTVRVHEIIRTNQPPTIGTGRQQFRSLPVYGAARTQGSLQIEHETLPLGQVLVYTNVEDGSGYQPACRQYRSGGATAVVDGQTASGFRSPMTPSAPEVYTIPAARVPAGTYELLTRVRSASTGTPIVGASAVTLIGGVSAAPASTSAIVALTANVWSVQSLGLLTLPPTALPKETSASVRITVTPSVNMDIDDLWICNLTTGALTRVDCGTAGSPSPGGPFNRLWIDTATLEWPRPAIWVGTEPDRSDARHVDSSECQAAGTHTLPPGAVNVFAMTSGAPYAAVRGRYHPRWPNNAGDVPQAS